MKDRLIRLVPPDPMYLGVPTAICGGSPSPGLVTTGDTVSDIRFDGDWVLIEGTIAKATSTDLMLDSAGRRRSSTPHRRALVHDFDDGLTVNWANDYPAGVTINAAKRINGHNNGDWIDVASRVVQVKGSDLMLDYQPRRANSTAFRRALVHGWNDTLTLNYNRDYPGGVLIEGPVRMPGGAVIAGQDVAAVLTSLSTQVSALSARVAALEAKLS